MARKFDMIKQIDGTRETLKLGVRIADMWFVQNRDKTRHLEMIITNAKGDKIQMVVKKEELVSWQSKLKEGSTYVMHNFQVICNEGQYKVCNHAYKLLFMGGTTLKEQHIPDVPMNVYQFKGFCDILSGNHRRDMLVDQITYQLPRGNPKKVVFNMKDLCGELVSCTLWEEHAQNLFDYVNQRLNTDPIIIILTQARIKEAQGVYAASISNSLHGSKLLVNESVPEIADFKSRFDSSEIDGVSSQSQGLTQLSLGSQFSEQDKFMYKAHVKSISEISGLTQDITCVTVGTTGKFVVGKGGWYYLACSSCNKKTDASSAFTCKCGTYNETAVLRYKLEIKVYYGKHNANFIFWDRDCADLIGQSALDLKNLMIQYGEDDPKLYPEPLDKMLRCTLAFRIKMQLGFKSASILKVSNDAELIQAIKDQIGPDQDTSEADKGTCSEADKGTYSEADKGTRDTNEVIHYDTQSLSRIADHDPDQAASLTPAKRLSPEIQCDELLSRELAFAQLSFTKMTKHIKTE